MCIRDRKYGVQIAVDFHKRWDPAYNNMRDEILMDKENIIRGLSLIHIYFVIWFAGISVIT